MNIPRLLLPLCFALGACMSTAPTEMPTRASTDTAPMLPPMKTFSKTRPDAPAASNADIARDFLDLAFRLESGRELPVLTRFEGPITLRVTGKAPISLGIDLENLLSRLRREAGIDIRMARSNSASITIEAVSHDQIRKQLPQAACFVVPNVSSLAEYAGARRAARTDWSRLATRERLAIFVPADAPPQELRDCLHEELAQALGPLNDLYRLPDSVFNDDNVHTVLTGYDMLILRAFYSPQLHSDMRRDEVAARLPNILAALNPAGTRRSSLYLPETPRSWIDAIQSALGPGSSAAARRAAAQRALKIARAEGWTDHRRAFSHYALGRLTQNHDADIALSQFRTAQKYYAQSPGTRLHSAQVAQQLAAYAVSEGRGQAALDIIDPYLDIAAQHENAALLSTLLLLRAEALDLLGRTNEARLVRLDSLGWARYGFGADWAVRAKLKEITALSPLKRSNGQL
ncbi:DUF2927 domain-containing protein [Thalassovita aquimarina]|uniref:DUF2927 domain-containing protein n=1 Tax=Thalassovita aquimarina TaxID=2785917 RepID=A0ABS5HXE3_9RHOB|nr:DUF2927 domain-containing protein [Thalassovita aquimarina]MBR9653238.1 DUF2927 domain-containing protein [Thalassovita aquimarina]